MPAEETPFLTTPEVCRFYRITRQTLDRWVRLGRVPPAEYFSARSKRWRRDVLEAHRAGLGGKVVSA
jgi:predicted DNA-binding transcriptional regulator AlpA